VEVKAAAAATTTDDATSGEQQAKSEGEKAKGAKGHTSLGERREAGAARAASRWTPDLIWTAGLERSKMGYKQSKKQGR
jgi:hypothetical protein